MSNKRKRRNKIDEEDFDLLKPIDILELGGEEDPCFGKLHDLAAKECKNCGDAEFCQIVKAQNLHKERLKIEKNQRFKDIEEADEEHIKKLEQVKDLIKEYKDKGFKRMKIILKISKKLSLPKETVKQEYDQI